MQLNFNAHDHTPADPNGRTPVPAGHYVAMIVESAEVPVKDQVANPGGAYLKLTYQIAEGPHAGRKLFHNLNLKNKSKESVKIANEQLSAICHAVKVFQVPHSQVLHNLPHIINVALKDGGVRPGSNPPQNYPPQNEIRGFIPLQPGGAGVGGNTAGVPGWGAQQQPQVQPAHAHQPLPGQPGMQPPPQVQQPTTQPPAFGALPAQQVMPPQQAPAQAVAQPVVPQEAAPMGVPGWAAQAT